MSGVGKFSLSRILSLIKDKINMKLTAFSYETKVLIIRGVVFVLQRTHKICSNANFLFSSCCLAHYYLVYQKAIYHNNYGKSITFFTFHHFHDLLCIKSKVAGSAGAHLSTFMVLVINQLQHTHSHTCQMSIIVQI